MTAQEITTENLNYIVCPTVGISEDKIFLCLETRITGWHTNVQMGEKLLEKGFGDPLKKSKINSE